MNPAFLLTDLLEVDRAFKEHGATMFLLYGTALGLYRDGKFLPGDEDLDIGSFDVDKRDVIAKTLEDRGFQVSISYTEERGYHSTEMIHAQHDTHVDIFFFKKTRNGWTAKRAGHEKPFVVLPPGQKKKFQTVTMAGHEFNALSPVEEYLDFCYDDWKDPAKKDHGKLYHDLKGTEFYKEIFHS